MIITDTAYFCYRYAKGSDPDNWLTIDPETAEIKLNKMPDRESPFLVNGTYMAKVLCISDGTLFNYVSAPASDVFHVRPGLLLKSSRRKLRYIKLKSLDSAGDVYSLQSLPNIPHNMKVIDGKRTLTILANHTALPIVENGGWL